MTFGIGIVLAPARPRYTKKPATRSATTRAAASHADWDEDSFFVATSRTGPSMRSTGRGGSAPASTAATPVSSGPTAGTTTVESLGGRTAVVFWASTDVAAGPSVRVAPSACTGWPAVKRSRSERKSSALWYRSSGDLASACMVTASRSAGTAGLRSRSSGGVLRTCMDATATGESPTYGVRPASIS